MASDYIAIYHGLPRRREVAAIAAATGRSRHEVVGLLIELWLWADAESANGCLADVTLDVLENVIGADASFWLQVVRVGWLEVLDGGPMSRSTVVIPRWQRRNPKSLKVRELATLRKRRQRKGKVADVPPESRAESRTMSRSRCVTDDARVRERERVRDDGDLSIPPFEEISISNAPDAESARAFARQVAEVARAAAADRGEAPSEALYANALGAACALRRAGGVRNLWGALRARLRAARGAEYTDADEEEARRILRRAREAGYAGA